MADGVSKVVAILDGAEPPPPRAGAAKAAKAGPKPASAEISEDSVALAFAGKYGGDLLFDHDVGCWYKWTGLHWQQDKTFLAFNYARDLCREKALKGTPAQKAVVGKSGFAAGVERFARADRQFAVTSDEWDNDSFTLGTPKGYVDLVTGDLSNADPEDRITKLTAVAPSEFEDCPRWFQFLREITGDDADLIHFLQQFFGYCLTGDTREHALVFAYGPGGNGKSVLLNTIAGILGEYAATAAMETFIASNGERHPADLAMLRGARFVSANETEEGRAWAESRIKQITGGDPITARFMRENFFTFHPTFKLFIVGNHQPVLRNIDDGTRRRFNIVPFMRKPPEPDRELEGKLREEGPGILRWMINGCLNWQARGLVRPDSVLNTTKEYFTGQDTIGQFLDEYCECDIHDLYRRVNCGELFAAWEAYAKAAGEKAGSAKAFTQNLQRRGFKQERGSYGVRRYLGIRLVKRAGSDT